MWRGPLTLLLPRDRRSGDPTDAQDLHQYVASPLSQIQEDAMPRIQSARLLIVAALFGIAACQGRDTPLAPPSKLAVLGGGLPGFPGTVTDLAVDAVTQNSATLSFTEVDDGLGQPARYVIRFAEPPIDWGSAREVTEGTCATPVIGQAVGARVMCTVLGLAPSTTYDFQVAAYRSTLDLVEMFGDPSNVAQGTTGAPCDCWTNKAFMPTPRYSLGVADLNGTLYAVGGYQGFGRYPAAVEAYDPASDTWTTRASLPTPRSGLGAAVVDGILYAVGGSVSGSGVVTTVEAYDPATDTWTTKAPMPTGRYRVGVAAVNGVLYAVGGTNDLGTAGEIVEAYDPVTDTWTTRAPMPSAFAAAGAAAIDGILYAEYSGANAGYLKTLLAYDPATDAWTTKSPMPTYDTGDGMVYFGVAAVGGMFYAVGGSDVRGFVKAYQP